MKKEFEKLFEPVQFKSGIKINSRFVMSPMVVEGSTYEGYVGEEDLSYFERRANVSDLLISGATSIAKDANAFGYGLTNADESYLEGMKKLAATMKKNGAKAITQLFHPGYAAKYSYQENKNVYAPSAIPFSFLDYPTTELSEAEVEQLVRGFGEAALRAIHAGFDGIEIHGANHYLIQQFFSKTSNKRSDKWGGSLENRARFALAIVDEIQHVIRENAERPFVLGYRLSPEEIHEETVGYTLDDTLYLIKQLNERELDYVHLSLFGPSGYRSKAVLGNRTGEVIARVVKENLNNATRLIVVGDITSADKALEAVKYADIAALASAVIVDPEFVEKIKVGAENTISLDITNRLEELKLPRNFYLVKSAMTSNKSIPQITLDAIK